MLRDDGSGSFLFTSLGILQMLPGSWIVFFGLNCAFQKYLELAPQGLYSERARNLLAEAGLR
jgi:hypothetical protein